MNERTITETMIKQFGAHLCRDEKSVNTIEKYLRDVQAYVDEGNYAKIFEQALNGDVYAEYIYLVYASANGGNVENYAERFLSQGRIHTTALAISGIIGLFCFLNAKNRLEYSGELQKDCEAIELAAENGDPAAMFYLGLFYLGKFSSQYARNEMKAYHYLKSAVDKEYPDALKELGRWYAEGENGVSVDAKLGKELQEKGEFYDNFFFGELMKKNGNEAPGEDFNLMLNNPVVNMAVEFLKDITTKKKKNDSCQESESYVTRETLWEIVRECRDTKELEDAKNLVEVAHADAEDKKDVIEWIKESIRDIKRYTEAIEEQKQKEDIEKKQREQADAIIMIAIDTENHPEAMDKIKELNLPGALFAEYKEILSDMVKEKYQEPIQRANRIEEDKEEVSGMYSALGIGAVICALIVWFLLWAKKWWGGLSIACLIGLGIAVVWFLVMAFSDEHTLTAISNVKKYKKETDIQELLQEYEKHGYDIFKKKRKWGSNQK